MTVEQHRRWLSVNAANIPLDGPWRFEVDRVALTVRRLAAGRWEVLYGGFSRVVSDRLADAIAVAAGANPTEPWIGDIARRCYRAAVET
jgi:hypothetical protein